ncbi:MAG: hypothetical protein NVS1B13_18380 [Flavisolibacter sp.]
MYNIFANKKINMINKNLFFKTIFILLVTTIIFTASSYAQQFKVDKQATSQVQLKQIKMQKVKMPVDGMMCNACQSNVKKAIKSIGGISDVQVSLEGKYALFTYDIQKVKLEQVQKAINEKGYKMGKPEEVKQ